ncbi:SLATT domain-containing protein [Actinomadura alba]|uniref:SLATT domain-containing protein n=1 Tax=Actinomadura alba TaxID=406431 RepID=A0ABR7M225_9ACTN|nr:SLATT domain-containing protein [Actinomadura alba]MBC6470742.1 SLATT domain-containing protein [Actinomadura alba]
MAKNDVLVKGDPLWRMAVGAELRRIEENCACAARGQAETVKIWRAAHVWLGTFAVLTAGVAGSVMLAAPRFAVCSGTLALVAAMLATVLSVVGPARRESQAVEAARAFQAVAMLSRQARQVDLPGQPFEQARHTLGELTERWQNANGSALPAPRWAQRRAERGIFPDLGDDAMFDRISDVVSVFDRPPVAEQTS